MSEVNIQIITLTDSAIEALKQIREEKEESKGDYLRIGVKGGGCSGLSYVLEFDEKNAFDSEYQIGDISFIVDQRHEMYIYGMQVDYQAGLNDRGFIFNNPNATNSCGCGTSFSTQ